MNRGGSERGGNTECETGSSLWAVSTEPDVGLELTDRKIMTWAQVGRSIDWATQAPLNSKVWKTQFREERLGYCHFSPHCQRGGSTRNRTVAPNGGRAWWQETLPRCAWQLLIYWSRTHTGWTRQHLLQTSRDGPKYQQITVLWFCTLLCCPFLCFLCFSLFFLLTFFFSFGIKLIFSDLIKKNFF